MAAVITVGASGCDYTTLDAAVAAAQPGDELRLRAQKFTGVDELISKSLTVRGGYSVCGDDFPALGAVSVLEGTGTSNLFTIGGGATTDVELIKLEMTGGGNALFGGAISVLSGATLRLATADIHNNQGDFGGAIYVGSDSVLEHSGPITLRDNSGASGGAIYLATDAVADFTTGGFHAIDVTGNVAQEGGGIYVSDGAVLRTDPDRQLSIDGNFAEAGGGIYAETSAELELFNVRVRSNVASIGGGGMFVSGDGSAATTTILIGDNTEFVLNQAGVGGGIAFGAGGGFNVEMDALISNNTAVESGGGLHVEGNGLLDINGTLIAANQAGTNGGGAYLGSSAAFGNLLFVNSNTAGLDGGGLYMTALSSLQIGAQLVARGNRAERSGGGIAVHGGAFLQVNGGATTLDLLLEDNEATTGDGGGLHVLEASVDLSGARIGSEGLGNVAIDGRGGGAFIDTDLEWSLRNFRVNSNRAGLDGGGLFLAGDADFQLGGVADGLPAPRVTQACNPSTLEPGRFCAEIRGNVAEWGGGGVVISGAQVADRQLFDFAIVDNVSGNPAAGVFMDAPGTVLRNVLIARNAGSAGLFVGAGTSVGLQHVSVLYNHRGLIGGGNEEIQVDHSMFWGNGGATGFGAGFGSIVTGDCNLGRSNAIPGVIGGNPRFIETARGVYRLSDESPALDACTAALLDADMDGLSRPEGSGHDVGAFEGGWGTSEVLLSSGFESGPLASPLP